MTEKTPQQIVKEFPTLLIGGHRGTRGSMPENSIPGMLKAVKDGCNMLEMDLQFTTNKEVVVAHDPYINRIYSLHSDGKKIHKVDSRKFILYKMHYEQIRSFDIGSKYYHKYPDQEKFKTHIPTLSELIDHVESYILKNELPQVIYSIEIKASPQNDNKYHPKPRELVRLVMDVLESKKIARRYYIQSFDHRQIKEVRKNYPDVPVAYLTIDKNKSVADHVTFLGFTPEIFSPQFKLATVKIINEAHKLGLKMIPWTVNKSNDMASLLNKGVDGIITDYPDRLYQLRN